jgi:uncharacterized membrane protein
MARITSYRSTEARYPTLRFAGALCTWAGMILLAVGAVLLAVGILGLIAGAAGDREFSMMFRGFGAFAAVAWSLCVLAAGLQFVAAGALCRLAIHVEENTRISAQCLEALAARAEPRREDGGPPFVS